MLPGTLVVHLILVRQIRPDIFIRNRIHQIIVVLRPQVTEGIVLRALPWFIARRGPVPDRFTTATIPFCFCHFVLTSHTTKQLFIPAL